MDLWWTLHQGAWKSAYPLYAFLAWQGALKVVAFSFLGEAAAGSKQAIVDGKNVNARCYPLSFV